MFMAHAPTSDTDDDLFSDSIFLNLLLNVIPDLRRRQEKEADGSMSGGTVINQSVLFNTKKET